MFFQNARKINRLQHCMLTFLLGISSAGMAAATNDLDTLKACQTAQAFFSISTNPTSPVSLAPGGATSIVYTITNNTTQLDKGLTKLTTSLKPSQDGKITVNITNSCTGALAKGASCIQTATITATENITGGAQYDLSALVCDAGSPTRYCSSTCAPGLRIQIANKPISSTRAFIANNGGAANGITQCNIVNGGLVNCTPFTDSALSSPYAITLNSAGTFVYVTNNNNSVATCAISHGFITSCNKTITPPDFADLRGIALNPAGTFAYVIDSFISKVIKCAASGSSLSLCTPLPDPSGSALFAPSGIVFNSTGMLAFIANSGAGQILRCTADISSCVNMLIPSLSSPVGIALNADNSRIYITDLGANKVDQCDLDAAGAASSCSTSLSGPPFNGPTGIAINTEGTMAYVTNFNDNTVLKCPINAGVIQTLSCIDSGATGLNLPAGIAIA